MQMRQHVLGKNYPFDEIANSKHIENKPIETEEYLVKVTANVLNIREGAGTNYKVVGQIKDKGTYTIVETKNNWGKLKSGAGWICLEYTNKSTTKVEIKKTVDEVAREVIRGDWGNGRDRREALENAGYDYNEVQASVNELM